jgi:hypothetical protein
MAPFADAPERLACALIPRVHRLPNSAPAGSASPPTSPSALFASRIDRRVRQAVHPGNERDGLFDFRFWHFATIVLPGDSP